MQAPAAFFFLQREGRAAERRGNRGQEYRRSKGKNGCNAPQECSAGGEGRNRGGEEEEETTTGPMSSSSSFARLVLPPLHFRQAVFVDKDRVTCRRLKRQMWGERKAPSTTKRDKGGWGGMPIFGMRKRKKPREMR